MWNRWKVELEGGTGIALSDLSWTSQVGEDRVCTRSDNTLVVVRSSRCASAYISKLGCFSR
jgi:hypothetical protein